MCPQTFDWRAGEDSVAVARNLVNQYKFVLEWCWIWYVWIWISSEKCKLLFRAILGLSLTPGPQFWLMIERAGKGDW